jgi:nucleotide-binding universal stress UspA family protein
MFRKILLATDGSAASMHAARLAVKLARSLGARLTALYVVDPYPYLGIGDTNLMGLQAYLSTANVHAGRALQEVAALCSQDGKPVDVQLRRAEDMPAAKGILDAAQEEGADLIVVGSHGRSGINRLMLGSIASKVVSQSTIPVLVARGGDAS